MKKTILLSLGVIASALLSAQAQNIKMFTTESDMTNWNAITGSGSTLLTFQATNALDLDGATANGIGGADSGVTSIGGSLQVSPIVPSDWNGGDKAGPVFYGPGVNGAVLTALDGPDAAYGSPLAAQSGTMYVDYTLPDHSIAGSYFGFGIFMQYDNNWGGGGQDWNPTDLGPVSTPTGMQEKYRATIPYTIHSLGLGTNEVYTTNADNSITTNTVIAPKNLSYFTLGFWIFTDYQGTNVWYIDNISVAPLPTTIIPAPTNALFVTSNDFNSWSSAGGDSVLADNTWSLAGFTTNGLGNTNAPGATGATAGSLLVNWSSLETGWGVIASAPNEADNASFMQAIDPGCNPGTQTSAAAYGNLYVTYSQPDAGGGNYFGFGVQLIYNSVTIQYGWLPEVFYPSSTRDLGYQDNNGYEVYQATIPYHINAGSYAGNFALNLFVNSNYQPTYGFHVGDISVSSAPTPIISAGMSGGNMVIQGTNGLTGRKYSLLSTTNLMTPATNWTAVSVGVSFNGPTFSATNAAATPSSFYMIKVQ